MARRLTRSFFARSTLLVARELLGARLVCRVGEEYLVGRVVDVEAYIGESDSACHASRGRTPRNAVMYGPPGHAYVYFTYGMHWMLNVVTERQGVPAAVLIRAIEPLEGLDTLRRRRGGRGDRELTSGPARLCQALGIDRELNGEDMVRGSRLYFEASPGREELPVATTPRIGIDYAREEDRKAPWRFVVAGNPHLSRTRART